MEYNYPDHLSAEELQMVLRKVVDNINTLRSLCQQFKKEKDAEKMLATQNLIDIHYVALEKFLKAHPEDNIQ